MQNLFTFLAPALLVFLQLIYASMKHERKLPIIAGALAVLFLVIAYFENEPQGNPVTWLLWIASMVTLAFCLFRRDRDRPPRAPRTQ